MLLQLQDSCKNLTDSNCIKKIVYELAKLTKNGRDINKKLKMNIKANYDGLNDHLLNEKNDLNETYSVYTQISSFIGIIASGFMIFGGVVPYIPQYQMINRTRNASGFSTLVCLALLVANILRIFFWFGHPFEMPLLVQSVIMILCMLIMLELCIRVKAEMLHSSSMLAPPVKRFLDFETDYFWKWTDFGSYLQFLATFSLLIGTLTSLFINSTVFIEFLGFMSVFTEAMLAAPQFYRNYVTKSTEGMSITMVLMWTSGDLFKTTYFILRQSPLQFWLCGILQVSLDLAVLSQAYLYSQNPNKNLK